MNRYSQRLGGGGGGGGGGVPNTKAVLNLGAD